MKNKFAAIFALLAFSLLTFSTPARAVVNAQGVTTTFATTEINGSTWTTVLSSTVKAVKGLTLLNTSAEDIKVGITLSGSANSTSVAQIIVPKLTTYNTAPVYYPLVISQGYKITLLNAASAGAMSDGALKMNVFYN